MKTRLITFVLLVALLFSVLAAYASPGAEEPASESTTVEPGKLKIAMLLDGPINDQGWNQGAYDGLAAVKTKYLADVAYSESVPRADMETVFHDYASRGFNVIIAHGFEFSDAAEAVASKYPNTIFIVTHGKGGLVGENVATIQYEEEQIGFLLGILAGKMTKSNKIACLGGYEIPPIAIPFEALEIGAQEVNPDAKVSVAWINSWTDIAKMKEATNAAISNGADVVLALASGASPGSLYAAEEAEGVWGLGYSGDQYIFAPEITLTSGIVDTGLSIQLVVDAIVD
ncbi:MAG: BMP family protein, partial [Spirochaetaceae bacterium]|nr:BMP family protein [Spirochaetaceae bacterium]